MPAGGRARNSREKCQLATRSLRCMSQLNMCADFILVSAGSPSHAQSTHDGVLRLERHCAWKRHNIADRCEPRRIGIGFHQIEKLAGRIKVKYRPQRDHRERLLETRFPRMDNGSIAT